MNEYIVVLRIKAKENQTFGDIVEEVHSIMITEYEYKFGKVEIESVGKVNSEDKEIQN